VLDLDGEEARSVVLTTDPEPLMLLAMASAPELQVRDGWSSQLLHRMTDMDVRRIQPLK
jgi:hypothetical protein